jgi:Ca-activated chloride channel homolog
MHWDDPHWLWFLWLLPAVGAVMGWARRRQRQAAERFAEATLLGRLVPPRSTTREWLKAALLLLGLACLIVSLARPRWGQTYQQVTSRGVDLFVLLDVSRSMLAQDVTPNRLERAKSDIRDLLVPLEGDRVGLIVFAGAAVVAVPLTTRWTRWIRAVRRGEGV